MAAAVQITAAVVEDVGRLSLFQRTPQWIMPIDNVAYDEAQRAAFRADPALMRKARDGLGRAFAERFANAVIDASSPAMAAGGGSRVPRGHLLQEVAGLLKRPG